MGWAEVPADPAALLHLSRTAEPSPAINSCEGSNWSSAVWLCGRWAPFTTTMTLPVTRRVGRAGQQGGLSLPPLLALFHSQHCPAYLRGSRSLQERLGWARRSSCSFSTGFCLFCS